MLDSGGQVTVRTNRLLHALSGAQHGRLQGALSPVFLDVKTILFEPGEVIECVDFPRNCVISLVTPLQEGGTVEVATVGNEGLVGVPMVAGGSLAVRAVCSMAGWVERIGASAFLDQIKRDPGLQELVDDYLQALFGQIAQAAACNRLHATEARLSRWLLMSQDRVGIDEFAITHDFLSQMLGSRRSTVTVAAARLRVAGLIRSRPGQVTIMDRDGLEAVACECYRVVRTALDGVIQRARLRSAMRGDSMT